MRVSSSGVCVWVCDPFVTVAVLVFVLVLVLNDAEGLRLDALGMEGAGVPPRAGLCVPLHGSTSYPLARGSEKPLLCMALARGVLLFVRA